HRPNLAIVADGDAFDLARGACRQFAAWVADQSEPQNFRSAFCCDQQFTPGRKGNCARLVKADLCGNLLAAARPDPNSVRALIGYGDVMAASCDSDRIDKELGIADRAPHR